MVYVNQTDHVRWNWSDERSDLVVGGRFPDQVLAVAIQNDLLQTLKVGLANHVAKNGGRHHY